MTESQPEKPQTTSETSEDRGRAPASPPPEAQLIPGVETQYALPGFPGPGLLGVQQTQQVQVWQGQFPPPDAIERYEAVLPGTFDRLIKMAEAQQAAQIVQAEQVNRYLRDDVRRGHWLGAGVTILAMACALMALHMRSPGVAVVFLSVTVMAVAKALIDSARPSPPKK